jgi:hypothetical protein
VRVHCGIYKGSYNVSNISYLNPSPLLLSFITPIPGTFSTGIIFAFTYVCYILFPPYSSSYSFPCHLPPPTSARLTPSSPFPGRTCSALLFYNFVEEKPKDRKRNMKFLLV